MSTKHTNDVLHVFSAKACAAPLRDAAALYQQQDGNPEIQISVCSRHCAAGVAEEANEQMRDHDFLVEISEAGIHDLAIGGAEYLLDDGEVRGIIKSGERRTIACRQSGILVPAGNPKDIETLEDLTKPDIDIAISVIDCLKGAWEDVCGRAGLIEDVHPNIAFHANGCIAIVEAVADGIVDAGFGWIGFDHLADGRLDVVPLSQDVSIWRATCVGMLEFTDNEDIAREFMDFLITPQARSFYAEYGWIT